MTDDSKAAAALDSKAAAALVAPQPATLAGEVCEALQDKASLPAATMAVLGVLAGAYIGFGGLFALVALAGTETLPHGVGQLLAGTVFVVGLVLVIVAGAELFTGNTLMAGFALIGRLPPRAMLTSWSIVYAANLAGALLIAVLAVAAGAHLAGEGAVGQAALKLAASKSGLGAGAAFASGILANMLVCLAVWMAYSARSTGDKIIAVLFPIAAFVAAGLEHSVANMFLLPFGWIIKHAADPQLWQAAGLAADAYPQITLAGMARNLAAVTLGNIVGGGLIALAYGVAFLRKPVR